MNTFAISGQHRKEKKKELAKLKSFVKNFWFHEDVDRVYGGGLEEYNEEVMDDFYKTFKEGVDISKKEWNEFCWKYVDDSSEGYYIDLNWKYIISGGDESVYEEC